MQLGENFSGIKAQEFTGFVSVNVSGQTLIVTNVEDTKSKAGSPMLVVSHNIQGGEFDGILSKFPVKKYIVYATDKQKGAMKGTFNKFIEGNAAMFPEEDPFSSGEFDEQRLIGCTVGADLDYNESGYLEIRWYTSVEDAEANNRTIVKPKKVVSAPKPSGATKPSGWGV